LPFGIAFTPFAVAFPGGARGAARDASVDSSRAYSTVNKRNQGSVTNTIGGNYEHNRFTQ
jgi:hypothetical protein